MLSFGVYGAAIYAGSYQHGIFRSIDSGTNWIAVDSGFPKSFSTYSFAVIGVNIFAGTDAGLLVSTNNGVSWRSVDAGYVINSSPIYSIGVSGNNLFVWTPYDGVFVSTDTGKIWNGVCFSAAPDWIEVCPGMPAGYTVYSFAPSGTDLFAGTELGIFLSTNGGSSWKFVNTGIPVQMGTPSLAVAGNNLFVGNEYGIFLTTNNGTNWRVVNNGLPVNTGVPHLAVLGDILFASSRNGIYSSINNGTSWDTNSTGLTNATEVSSLITQGSNIYAGTEHYGLFRSTNNGINWTPINSGLPSGSALRNIAAIGTKIFAGTNGEGVFLSADNGENWNAVNDSLTMSLSSTHVTSLIAKNTILFAVIHGDIGQAVVRTSNNGANWVKSDSGLPVTAYGILSLAVCGPRLFASTDGAGIFVSDNNGTTWHADSSGLPTGGYVYPFSMSSYNDNVFAATDSGVFLSTNEGRTWTSINDGLTTATNKIFVADLAVKGSYLYAGTLDNGVWRRSLSEMVGVINQNPALSYTSINRFNSYAAIYDLHGRYLGTTHTNQLPTNLRTGIYFLRSTGVSGRITKQCVVR